jgi:hypothetical protein
MSWVSRGVLVGLALLVGPQAHASQDEMTLPLAGAERMFSAQTTAGVHPLTGAASTISLAPYYLHGAEHHRYHGRVAGDVALLSFGPDVVLHMGLSIETVSDYGNDISFRLVRLYYEWLTAVDFRLGPGVMSIGVRHRCSHGADASVDGRILIRTGLEVAYALEGTVGGFGVASRFSASGIVVGQNPDHTFQPRALLNATGQLSYPLGAGADWFVAGGLGLALVGDGDSLVYTIADGTSRAELALAPAAAVGVSYRTQALGSRVLIHYQRLLDSGFTLTSLPADIVSLRVEFEW